MGSSFRLYWRRLHDYLQGVPALKRDFGTRPRSGRRPFVEYLEDRIVPAFSLTLSLNATVGVMTSANFPVPGTTTFSATASGANLSWVDIANTLAVAGKADGHVMVVVDKDSARNCLRHKIAGGR